MDICSDNHEEIAYEGRQCPACDIRADKDIEIKDLEKDNKNLEKTNEKLEEELEELKTELERLKQRMDFVAEKIIKKSW